MDTKTILVTDASNQEFLERHATAGRLGLCGGSTNVDIAIRRAQRHLDGDGRWSNWSHAFLFQGLRADGQQWVMESDLQFHRKHIQLGAQENRIEKYFDEKMYPTLAVLDFGLSEAQVAKLLREGLDRVASHDRYSVRELIGTLLALRKPELRAQENLLARERCVYCSAFVQQLFHRAGLDLSPGIAGKNTTPEDLFRTPVPHTKYLLVRELPGAKLAALGQRLRTGLRKKRVVD